MDVSKTIKITASTLTVLGLVLGAVFFMDDRHQKVADAKEMKKNIVEKINEIKKEASQITLETFKDVQQSLKSIQQSNDLNRLESLRNEKYLMKKQLDADPTNELLKDRVKRLEDIIEKLENKLYN